jgi:prolyl-tRNA synthetase
MGSYGIGIERILTAAIEQTAGENGFWLSPAIAPFPVVITVTNQAEAQLAGLGERLAGVLAAAGLDVLLDDREDRAGVKFKDADLIGVPLRVNVGRRAAEGGVELVRRDLGAVEEVQVEHLVAAVSSAVAGMGTSPGKE